MFFRCYFSEIGVEEVGVCVARHEPQGGEDWRTEPSFFPWREGGEFEIRSGSGGSGLSRPGLSHGLTLAS